MQCDFVYKNKPKKGFRCQNIRKGKTKYCAVHKWTCIHGIRKNFCNICVKKIKYRQKKPKIVKCSLGRIISFGIY